MKKVTLTQLFSQDPEGLKTKKSAVGFTAFLQLLMPDVYHEERYRWITTSFQKVRETEGTIERMLLLVLRKSQFCGGTNQISYL